MAGRTFYKAADGSLTPAGKARAYNAELRRRGKEGMLYTGESNFGTAGKDTGEIGYGEADDYVKNGDIIAVENEDGTISRTRVNEDNREELLGTRRGTMKPKVQEISDYGPYQEGQKLKGGTTRRYNDDEKPTSGGGRAGGRAIVIPASFNEPSKGGAKGARIANRNKQKVLQGKPLVSKAQKAYASRRAASKIKTANKNKRLKKSRDKARAATQSARKKTTPKKRRTNPAPAKSTPKRSAPAKATPAKATPRKATGGGKPKTRRTSTDSTATKVKKKIEKKAPAQKKQIDLRRQDVSPARGGQESISDMLKRLNR